MEDYTWFDPDADPSVQLGTCVACRNLIGDPRTRAKMFTDKGYDFLGTVGYITTTETLTKSSNAGCIICKHLQAMDRQYGFDYQSCTNTSETTRDERLYRFTIWGRPRADRTSIYAHGCGEFNHWGKTEKSFDVSLRFHVSTDRNDLAFREFPNERVHMDVGSSRAFAWARNQLHQCLIGHEVHQECVRILEAGDSVLLPTRLLKIQLRSKRYTAQLYISKVGETGSYATLSYCWGGPQHHATTRNRLKRYQESIPIATIPKTITDAMRAAKELGFSYLWIDSYCIVQDSVEDKEAELARMDDIYKMAAFNICAASSQSVHDGFLHHRSENMAYTSDSRCTILSAHHGTVRHGRMTLDVDWLPQPYGARNDAIHRRGWTLQESLLSGRRLYYGAERIFWICPRSFEVDGGPITQSDKLIMFRSLEEPYMKEMVKLSTVVAWTSALKDYSTRCLTYEGDKLPAISGLAKLVQQRLGWTYLAGLWREHLAHDILWRRVPSADSKTPTRWRAPSWSWASLDTAIEYDWCVFHVGLCAKIVNFTVEPIQLNNPLGRLRRAELIIKGHLRAASLSADGGLTDEDDESPDRPDYFNAQDRPPIGTWILDREKPLYELHPSKLEQLRLSTESQGLSHFLTTQGKSDPQNGDSEEKSIVWCLSIGSYRYRSDWQPSYFQILRIAAMDQPAYNRFMGTYQSDQDLKPICDKILGLLLMKTKNGRYQRVGTFVSSGYCDATYWFKQPAQTTVTIV